MSKHTPGPWREVSLGEFGRVNVIDAKGKAIAFTGTSLKSRTENEANARLVAAVPNLLAACKAAQQHYRDTYGIDAQDYELYQIASDAIAKAEGTN